MCSAGDLRNESGEAFVRQPLLVGDFRFTWKHKTTALWQNLGGEKLQKNNAFSARAETHDDGAFLAGENYRGKLLPVPQGQGKAVMLEGSSVGFQLLAIFQLSLHKKKIK